MTTRPPILRLSADELIVDNFAGGGGASTGIEWALGKSPDIAINHDPEALAMHAANHPSTRHYCESVWDVDPMVVCGGRPVGVAWFSPDCFPAGTMVLTKEGYVAIEDVQVGDEVLTHERRWRRVTNTMKSVRPLVRLRGHGHPGLLVSPEHPFYARLRKDVWRPASTGRRGYERTLEPADWVRAGDLDRGWYWASPSAFPISDIPAVGGRGMTISPELLWLAGRYVADGWTRLTATRAELVITCGRHEVADLSRGLAHWPRSAARATQDELAWHERETATAYQFSTNHRGFVEWLREHFGHGAAEKKIPGWLLGAVASVRKAFLDGYLSGDGCVSKGDGTPVTLATTVSKALAFGLKHLAQTFGYAPSVYLTENCDMIQGRKVNARPSWTVKWRAEIDAKHAQTFHEEGYVWAAVRERVDNVSEAADVYNLSVEEDESYVADGITVHNCTFHSKARGAKPFRDRDTAKRRRGLAWVVTRWARAVRPRIIALENVEEFEDWGPLNDDGSIDDLRRGFTYRRWKAQLENLGYVVESKQLKACDYGAPTTRKRLFIIARCDGLPIVWPEETHGEGLTPYRTAADCIDWSYPTPSIFLSAAEAREIGVRRPLSDNTCRRIARGVYRYVLEDPDPFIVPSEHGPAGATLIQTSWGERPGQAPRVPGLHKPLGTVMAGGCKHAVVLAFLAKHYGGSHANGKPKCFGSKDLRRPMDTVTVRDHHSLIAATAVPFGEEHYERAERTHAFLLKYFGTDQNPHLREPLHTVTTRHRFALVTVRSVDYVIIDIGLRMLKPRELFNAQGFKSNYIIDPVVDGSRLTETAQVRMCGNAVSPFMSKAIIEANCYTTVEEEKQGIAL